MQLSALLRDMNIGAPTADDRRVAPELVKVLKGSGQPVPAELAQLAAEAKAESWYRPNSRYQ